MMPKSNIGPRKLSLDLNAKSAEAFARLKDRYHVDSDAEMINRALTFMEIAGRLMDESGILVVGEGGNKKTIHMRR